MLNSWLQKYTKNPYQSREKVLKNFNKKFKKMKQILKKFNIVFVKVCMLGLQLLQKNVNNFNISLLFCIFAV